MKSDAGRPAILANPHADRVRQVAGLVGRSARRRSGLILVEGPQAVRELIRYQPGAIRDIYLTAQAAHLHNDIADEAQQVTRWVHEVTPEVAQAMSGDAQGVIGVARAEAISQEIPDDLGLHPALVLIAQGRDPGNVGTIIRTSDAMGASGVLTVNGTVDCASPKVIRASAGSVFHLPIIPFPSFESATVWARQRGVTMVGTSGGEGTETLASPTLTPVLLRAHMWVLGNEAAGLSATELDQCDLRVRIPMTGLAESLNVSSAAAMCLWESQRARA